MKESPTYKRAAPIEAIRWTGENPYAVRAFTGTHQPDPERGGNHYVFTIQSGHGELYVASDKAWRNLEIGDWVIADREGYHSCTPDEYAELYYPYSELETL